MVKGRGMHRWTRITAACVLATALAALAAACGGSSSSSKSTTPSTTRTTTTTTPSGTSDRLSKSEWEAYQTANKGFVSSNEKGIATFQKCGTPMSMRWSAYL